MSVTNHCLNSAAAVAFAIGKESQIDNTGFYALRQAEVSCRSYEQELLNFQLDIERRNRAIQKIENRILVLRARINRRQQLLFQVVGTLKDWVYKLVRLPAEDDELFDLEQSLVRIQHDNRYLKRDHRDVQMQLNAAQKAKEAFYLTHPELQGMTYEEIQEILTEKALLNRVAASFFSNVWAGQHSLAARELIELNPQQIQYILQRENEFRAKLEGYEFNTQLNQVLAEVSSEEREQILTAAIATVRQAKLMKESSLNVHKEFLDEKSSVCY